MSKLKYVLFLVFVVCWSLSAQERDCSKFTPELSEEIKRELELFQIELIENGYLKNDKAKSFIKFFRENAKTGFENLSRSQRPLLDDHINDLVFGGCSIKLEYGKELEALLAFQIANAPKMLELQKSLEDTHITPTLTGTFVGDLMNAKDLKVPSIRRKYLLTLVGVILPDDMSIEIGGLLRGTVEEKIKTAYDTEIKINAHDELFIDGVKSDSSRVFNTLDQLLNQYRSDITVIVSAKRQSSYDAFIKVLDIINKVYNKYYDQLSQKHYGLNFDQLETEARRNIQKLLVKNVLIKDSSQ